MLLGNYKNALCLYFSLRKFILYFGRAAKICGKEQNVPFAFQFLNTSKSLLRTHSREVGQPEEVRLFVSTGQQNAKGQVITISISVDCKVSVTISQLCCGGTKAAMDNK